MPDQDEFFTKVAHIITDIITGACDEDMALSAFKSLMTEYGYIPADLED